MQLNELELENTIEQELTEESRTPFWTSYYLTCDLPEENKVKQF